jgi:hypothetical protein
LGCNKQVCCFRFAIPSPLSESTTEVPHPKKEDGEKKNPKPGQTRFWIWAKKKIKIKKKFKGLISKMISVPY